MGMFDYVVCEVPLPDAAAKQVTEWQTKDFDMPGLDVYRISPEGRLMAELFTVEDRSDKTAKPGTFASIMGMMTRVHSGWEDMNYHGVLNFYGSTSHDWKGEWVEYNATFTHGQLEKIERLPDRSVTPSAVEAPSSEDRNSNG